VDGKNVSRFKDFQTYSAAKREADNVMKGLAKGSLAPALSPGQASDAMAAFQRLQHNVTGDSIIQ
jgi:hypothetical protein